jgi:hypothetical protein
MTGRRHQRGESTCEPRLGLTDRRPSPNLDWEKVFDLLPRRQSAEDFGVGGQDLGKPVDVVHPGAGHEIPLVTRNARTHFEMFAEPEDIPALTVEPGPVGSCIATAI